MKFIFLISLTFITTSYAKQPSEIILMGTFHFANPGLDKVKSNTINVMTEKSQLYLEQLSKNLSQFIPTLVLLEFDPADTEEINTQYQKYLTGSFELPSNEIYQIGFRVAKLSNVKRIQSLDEQSISWEAENLFKYLETKDADNNAEIQEMIKNITEITNNNHKTLPLKNLLMLNNDIKQDQINKNFYIATNSVGAAEGSFYGADSSASWWHRNFRIYAKIQNYAKTHTKIFALAGQGHTAILRDFITTDKKVNSVKIDF